MEISVEERTPSLTKQPKGRMKNNFFIFVLCHSSLTQRLTLEVT